MKFDVVVKQSKLNILRLLLSKSFGNKENNCCFTDCVQKTKSFLNTVMHSDIYELVLFKHSMMMDTIVLYILILV